LEPNREVNLRWNLNAVGVSSPEVSAHSNGKETRPNLVSTVSAVSTERTVPADAKLTAVKSKVSSVATGKPARVISKTPLVDPSDWTQGILSEDVFLGILCLERKRAERSPKKLCLLLIEVQDGAEEVRKRQILKGAVKAANAARRETDPAGWYDHNEVLGIIFTELGTLDDTATSNTLLGKIHQALITHLSAEEYDLVRVSIHIFACDSDQQGRNISGNPTFYPDLFHRHESKKTSLLIKRAMDIVGSVGALILFAPLFLVIAIAIKLSSKGPVLFKQERLGTFGKTFMCLKFRSMYANNDLKIHQEFMKRVISGAADGKVDGTNGPVYKMTHDPRITKIGRILRRTSFDELPQFFNVLKGEMSLVGPRPPLAYEYEEYDVWHRRRVLEAKPGITGLWQVKGRSRVRFDDMVRLDLQYARGWSLWLDLQILFATPRAVVFGDDAY